MHDVTAHDETVLIADLVATPLFFLPSPCLGSGGECLIFLAVLSPYRPICFSSTVNPNAPTFHSVTTRFSGDDLVGQLDAKDHEWTCAGGFATETQTFYNVIEGGQYLMVQVVHSSVG